MKKLFLALILPTLLAASPAAAQWARAPETEPAASATGSSEQIAAVVNEAVISTSDVKGRLALALFSSGLPDSPEVRTKLLPQVLRNLIDEQLQLQEGKRLEIAVSAEEINTALRQIAKQNEVPGGDMEKFLAAHNVPPATLRSQARATLTWNKVVMRELRPRIDVGDDEVQAAVDRIKASAGKPEFLVSEIFLAVDNPKDDGDVAAFTEQMVDRIRGGGNFGAMARQFSQGSGAANGGDIGWIREGQLAPELNKILLTLQPGEITTPIRSGNGYYILGLREKRTVAETQMKDVKVGLQQVFAPLAPDETKDELMQRVEKLRAEGGCGDLSLRVKRSFPDWLWTNLGTVPVEKLPRWIADCTKDLTAGQAAAPIVTDKGALTLFLCSREGKPDINRDTILNTIGTERLELLARRQMRDLRRNAYLDVRLGSP